MKNKAIAISEELYQKLEKRSSEAGFSSVEEYVKFILEEVIKEEVPEETLTKEDEAEIKKRLKALGYQS